MSQSCSTYLHGIGTKIHTLPRYGLLHVAIRLPGINILCSIGFGVVLFTKECFYLPVQFCKAVDFTLVLLYMYTNFKLQYLMNYSSDFNSMIFGDSDC